MSGYNLHKYGDKIIQRSIEIDKNSTVFTKTCSRIVNKNGIAIKPNEYRSVEFSDKVFILSLPMSPDETGKIYEIENTNAYIDYKLGGQERRIYPISKLKLIKELNQKQVNQKLYNMSFSSYKK